MGAMNEVEAIIHFLDIRILRKAPMGAMNSIIIYSSIVKYSNIEKSPNGGNELVAFLLQQLMHCEY